MEEHINEAEITRVEVYQGENLPEVQLVRSKLEEAGIPCDIENSYMSFLGTPTSNTLKIMVKLKDEQKAFAVIDEYLKD